MPAMSEFFGNSIINATFRGSSFTSPPNLYFALCTVMPEPENTGTTITEPSGGAYARVAVAPTSGNFTAPSNRTTFNNTAITFPNATATWGTIVAVAVTDAVTGGDLLFFSQIWPPVTIVNGSPALTFGLAQYSLAIDN